jgi:hypothetical protein
MNADLNPRLSAFIRVLFFFEYSGERQVLLKILWTRKTADKRRLESAFIRVLLSLEYFA